MAPSDGVASGAVAPADPDPTMQTPPSTTGSAASSTHGSTASGTVAPHEEAPIDDAPGPRRAPSNSLLPAALQLFLERYPQPAFVLRASTIHESIVAAKTRHAGAGSGGIGSGSAKPECSAMQQPAGEGDDGVQDGSECAEEHLTSRQQYEGVITAEESRERAEDERDLAQLADAPGSDSSATSLPPDLAPASQPFEAAALEGRRPRAHARAARVLSAAFAADEAALAASIVVAPGQEPDVLRKSALLEGGSQKSHDPSRTAEGAVRALYARRSEAAREKRATDDRAVYEEMQRRRGGPAEEEGPVSWAHSGVPGSEVRWRTSPQTSPQSSNGPQSPGVSSDQSRDTAPAPMTGRFCPSSSEPTAPSSASTLKALLTPLWHNPMWAEMIALREDVCEPVDSPSAGHIASAASEKSGKVVTVPLLHVLSTSDAQGLLRMLATVVDAEPGPTKGASPSSLDFDSTECGSSTVLLELRLPATSTHRHVPGSPSIHKRRPTGSGEADAVTREVAGDPPSSISEKVAAAEDASNMSSAFVSSPGPRLPPTDQDPAIGSAARQQETRLLRPFMQVVATLWPESDLILCTAILTHMSMPVQPEPGPSERKTSLRETDTRASKEADKVSSAGPSAMPTVGEVPQSGEAPQSSEIRQRGDAPQSDERPEPQEVSSPRGNAHEVGRENASSRRPSSAEGSLTTPPSSPTERIFSVAAAFPPSPSTPIAEPSARPRSHRPSLLREGAAEDVPRLSTLPSEWYGLYHAEGVPMQDLEEEDERLAMLRRRGQPTSTVLGGTRQPAPPSKLKHKSMPSLMELDEDVNPRSPLDAKESAADEQALDRLRLACRTGSTGSLAGSIGSPTTTSQHPTRQEGEEEEDGADEAEGGLPLQDPGSSSALTVATERAPSSIASSRTTCPPRPAEGRQEDPVSSQSEERLLTNIVPLKIDTSESYSADAFRTLLLSSECGCIILTLDWSSTSLGDISEWSPELRSHVLAILACPFQLALWIGPDGVLLYNDAYARLIGSKHPAALGKSGAEAWAAAAWSDAVEFASMNALGQITLQHDQCVMLTRDGILEECYVTWAYSSLRDGEGRMIGYQHPSFETTARVIAERRLSTLREISQQTLMVQNIEELAKSTLCALETNVYDLPFALLYTCDTVSATPGKRTLGKGATETSTHSSSRGVPASRLSAKGAPSSRRIRLKLQGTIGVPEGHSSAPPKITCALFQGADFDASSGTWSFSSPATNDDTCSSTTSNATSTSTVWPIVEALHTRKPVFMSDLGKRVEGFSSRGWPDPLERGVVVPILEEGAEVPGAILIVGLNPRRPFNSPYSVFLSLIARTISTALLSVATYQEQVRKARDLAAMYDARGAFFASVSHELRTPLTLILGPLEDVLASADSKVTKNDRDRLETVRRASHRLHNMVNNLLDVSQLESGRLNCKFRPMQIGLRVCELAELFRPAIERSGITFDVQHEEDKWSVVSPFYMADEFLERMLFNLLGNALKYTLSGTIRLKVSFDASSACISISDTGIGIREEELEVIFERFHRVESTSRSFEGSGMGLALVLGLVETCGGTITVASTVDEGSTFTIRLPRGSQHVPPDALETEPFESLSPVLRTAQSLAVIGDAEAWRYEPARSTPITPSDGSGSFLDPWTPLSTPSSDVDRFEPSMFDLRKESTVCLVVDDNPQMRAWISSELAKNWTVVEAANGKDALDYALGHPVSIIVTDLAMPVMNGRELLYAIRDHPSTQAIPIIFLSAQAGTDARVEALLLGADDFMTKPFQSTELVARVKVHLQLGEVRKELERRVEERMTALVDSERKYREISDQYQTLSLMSPVGIFQTDSSGHILFANPRFSEITGCSRAGPYAGWQDSVVPEDASKVHRMWDGAVQEWKADRAVVTSEFRFVNGKWVQLELRAYEQGYIGSLTDISHQKEVEAFHLDEVEKRAKDAEETRRGTEAFMDMASHELRNPLSGMWQNAEVVLTSLKTFLAWLDRLQVDQVCDTALLHEMRREMAENVDGVESIRICAEHQKRIADDIINVSKLNLGLLSIELAPCNLEGVLHDVLKNFDAIARSQHVELSLARDASLDRLGVEVVVADAGRIRQLAWNFISNALKYAAKSSSKAVSVRLEATDTAPSQSPSSRRIAAPEQSFDPPPGYIWCLVSIEDSGPGLCRKQLDTLFARFSQANPRTDQYGGGGLGLYISKSSSSCTAGLSVESTLGVGSRFTFAFPAKRVEAEERALDTKADVAVSSSQVRDSAASERPQGDVSTTAANTPSYFEAPERGPSDQQVSSSAMMGPLRVLVVEDNVINQKVMSRQLKQQGFEVTIAGDGQQALDALSADTQKIVDAQAQAASSSFAASAVPFPGFHIVLMDIEMPVMDGLTAIRELRRREREGEIPRHYPVCAVTGNAREAQRKECLDAGFDDLANKPYDLARLLQQISRLVGLPLTSPQ